MSRLYLKRRLSIVALLFVLAQGAGASDLKRILYGTTASPSHLPVWVAKDAGLFEKNGLDVEPVQIRGGSLITLAIITGNLPFSGAGAESVVAARAAGGDVVLLAAGMLTCTAPRRPVIAVRIAERIVSGMRSTLGSITESFVTGLNSSTKSMPKVELS